MVADTAAAHAHMQKAAAHLLQQIGMQIMMAAKTDFHHPHAHNCILVRVSVITFNN